MHADGVFSVRKQNQYRPCSGAAMMREKIGPEEQRVEQWRSAAVLHRQGPVGRSGSTATAGAEDGRMYATHPSSRRSFKRSSERQHGDVVIGDRLLSCNQLQ